VPWSWKSRAIPLLNFPYRQYGLYRASVPVQGCTLTYFFFICRSIRCHIPEDLHLLQHRFDNVTSPCLFHVPQLSLCSYSPS